MGYRCARRVTIFDYIFWTHFYNVKTGAINSAIYSNLYAFYGELNYTPFSVHEFLIGLRLCHNLVVSFLRLLTLQFI